MQYIICGDSIVDTKTGHVKMRLTVPKWEATLKFECKLLNGLLAPVWIGDTLIFVPNSKHLTKGRVLCSGSM